MATSYLNMAQTTTAEKLVRRAKALCRLPSTSSGLNFLGSSTDAVLDELSDLVNDAIRDVLDDCPILNISEETLTATAGSASTTLPADLRHSDIMGLEWAYTSYYGKPIRLLQRHEVDAMDDSLKDEGMSADPPDYCYLGWGQDGAAVYWLPRPVSDREFKVIYRATPIVITPENVGVEGTVTGTPQVVPFPDAMMDLLIYKLAEKISSRNQGSDGMDWQVLSGRYDQLLDSWSGRLAQSPYSLRMGRGDFGGVPWKSAQNPVTQDLVNSDYETH